MFQVAVVVFREFLEISILVSLFSISARNIKDFKILLVSGIMLGAFGASLIAFFTDRISSSLEGVGSEIFDSVIILITVAMICSTLIWMKAYNNRIKTKLSSISDSVEAGSFSKILFVLLISTTIFREGSEIVLLLHSISKIQKDQMTVYLNGFCLGSILGILAGIAIYIGLFKMTSKYIFKISSILMTFIAAGLSAEAARILSSIGMIDIMTNPLWDTSFIIKNDSVLGKFFKIIIGYSARPSGIELIFYFSTIALIVMPDLIFSRKKS